MTNHLRKTVHRTTCPLEKPMFKNSIFLLAFSLCYLAGTSGRAETSSRRAPTPRQTSNPTTPTSGNNPVPPTDPPPTEPSDPPATPTMSVADQIAADMQGKVEGYPHGVPLNYDWANAPVVESGNNSGGWKAITSWGLVYEAAEGNHATNTRVNIRNVQLWFLQKRTNKWLLLQNTSVPDGAAYVEDFVGDVNKPANIRHESDGSISVTAGGGYAFHFYPSDRSSINPNDIGGVVAVLQARWITADPSKTDDRSTAHYLAAAGADYWPNVTGELPNGPDSNPGIGVGKLKYVQVNWRSFAMSTVSQANLESNPPPVDLTGILP